MFVHPSVHLENRRWEVLTAANQFGHRETDGIVVDLFWNHRNLKDERVEELRGVGAGFDASDGSQVLGGSLLADGGTSGRIERQRQRSLR
jgi:hypothetical protein